MKHLYFTVVMVGMPLLAACSGSENSDPEGSEHRARLSASAVPETFSGTMIPVKNYQPGVLNEDKLPQVTSETLRILDFLRQRMSGHLASIAPVDPAQLTPIGDQPATLDISEQLCTRGGQASTTRLSGPLFSYSDGQVLLGAGSQQRMDMQRCDGPLDEPFVRIGSYTLTVASGLFDQYLAYGSENGRMSVLYEYYGSVDVSRIGIYQHGDIQHTLHSPLKLELSGQSYRELPFNSRRLEFALSDYALTLEKQPSTHGEEDGQMSGAQAFRIGLGSLAEDYIIELMAPLKYNARADSFWSGTVLLSDGSAELRLELFDGYTEYHFDAEGDGIFETVQVL
ncbi:hypothetical protein [Allohahella marinimesophila]|uniref:Lipoprotein n=1 Tax=Allohahella marinimesophila TaxID=1054972 RepID=A0ABP7Q2X8_9GAMM